MQQLDQILLDSVIKIAHQAGEFVSEFYKNSIEVEIKEDKTPVTEADLFVSKFLINALTELTPEIPVLSEENCDIPLSEREKWAEYWIIDPIDGTKHFINHTDQFAVMIALVQNKVPTLCVIHAPALEKTYYASKGQGAFLIENNQTHQLQKICKKFNESHRLRVALGATSSQKVIDATQPPYEVEFIPFGSSGLKAGLVAEGKADCYIRLGKTGEWDTAVAEVLLGETGGEILTTQFKPLTYNQRESLINPPFIMVGDKTLNWEKIYQFDSY